MLGSYAPATSAAASELPLILIKGERMEGFNAQRLDKILGA